MLFDTMVVGITTLWLLASRFHLCGSIISTLILLPWSTHTQLGNNSIYFIFLLFVFWFQLKINLLKLLGSRILLASVSLFSISKFVGMQILSARWYQVTFISFYVHFIIFSIVSRGLLIFCINIFFHLLHCLKPSLLGPWLTRFRWYIKYQEKTQLPLHM